MPTDTRTQRKKGNEEDFPTLKALGLMSIETQGNGNCLFHAFSDQLYGNQSHADEIRALVVRELKRNANRYRPFATTKGGSSDRYPRRRNAALNTAAATERELEIGWNRYLDRIAKNGTFGDHFELQAFADAFKVGIKIYQNDTVFGVEPASQDSGKILHVAYHKTSDHYSSVRNYDSSLPNIPVVRPDALSDVSPTTVNASRRGSAVTISAKGQKSVSKMLRGHEISRMDLLFD